MKEVVQGTCSGCDWKGRHVGRNAKGDLIQCEAWEEKRCVPEVRSCERWTRGERFPGEAYAQYTDRKEKAQLAGRADRRSKTALVVSIVALVVAFLKFIFDVVAQLAQ